MFTKTQVSYKITYPSPRFPDYVIVHTETTDEDWAVEVARELHKNGETPTITKTETVLTQSVLSF